ncbi:head completion protein, partial [archaeon]|nr:head completion protein [archaeon]
LKWCSEEFFIPYLSPKDNKVHRYFPDFLVKKQKDGVIETLVIEIKPKAQTMPPKMNGKQTKRMITEAMTYAVNEAKWKAAKEFCADRKYKFIILTEHELGIKF